MCRASPNASRTTPTLPFPAARAISAAAAPALPTFLQAKVTRAPPRANSLAVTKPMPLLPPVTTAVFPRKSIFRQPAWTYSTKKRKTRASRQLGALKPTSWVPIFCAPGKNDPRCAR